MANTYVRGHGVLFVDFVTRFAPQRERFGGWELVTVPERAPPPEQPYRVLSLGIHYRNGLYGIEQLRVREFGRRWHRKLPQPEVALPPDPQGQAALARQARAVIVGVRFMPSPPLNNVLRRHFRRAAAYNKQYAIWIRR